MKANRYPQFEDIVDSLKESDSFDSRFALVDLSVKVAEVLTGQYIASRRIHTNMFLQRGDNEIPYFPVVDFKINGNELVDVEIDLEYGIAMSRLAPSDYEVSYKVGFEDGELPAVLRDLIFDLGKYLYSGNEELKQGI